MPTVLRIERDHGRQRPDYSHMKSKHSLFRRKASLLEENLFPVPIQREFCSQHHEIAPVFMVWFRESGEK